MSLKTKILYNWFTIGLRCQIQGHYYRKENITHAPDYNFVSDEPGVIKMKRTGKTRMYRVYVCAYCGLYRGMNYEVIERA